VDFAGVAGHGTNAVIAIMTMPCDDANHVQHQSQGLWYTTDITQPFTFGSIVMPNFGPADFRDPSTFWSATGNCWIATLSEANQISVYTSSDLKTWSYQSHILPSGYSSSMGTPECTSLTRLHYYAADGSYVMDKWVLMCD
jgi:sucrose-6-phosphate hydrolase SacC (GH32 family)